MPTFRRSSRLASSNSRTSPDAKSAVKPTLNGLGILHLGSRNHAKAIQHPANRAQQQTAIAADRQQLKTLFQSHSPVFGTRRHYSAGHPGPADPVFDTQNLLSNARAFPL